MEKRQFDDAIGEPPPSTVDVDGVLARARRKTWLRRGTTPWTVTAVGVVAVTVGAVVFLSPGGTPELGVAPAEQPTPMSAPSTTGAPSAMSGPPFSPCGRTPTAPPTVESPAGAVTRLTAVLTAAVQRQLPGTTFEANPAAEYPDGTTHGPFEFFHVNTPFVDHGNGSCEGGADYFLTRATTVTAGVKGNVLAMVARTGGNSSPPTECSTGIVVGAEHDCALRGGPNGEIIVISTLSSPSGVVYHRADVTKTDGTGVMVQSENVAVDGKAGGPPESPTPQLSHDQLIQIALDPALTLYP